MISSMSPTWCFSSSTGLQTPQSHTESLSVELLDKRDTHFAGENVVNGETFDTGCRRVGNADATGLESDEDILSGPAQDAKGMNLRNRERARKLTRYEHIRKERKAIQNMTKPLKLWLCKNKAHPYPTRADKLELASLSNMSLTQVNNWFANARRRLKNTVSYPDLAWDERIRLYNSHVSANAELLSEHSIGTDSPNLTAAATTTTTHQQRVQATGDNSIQTSQCKIPAKFKQTILQRYLNDSIKYGYTSTHYPDLPPPSLPSDPSLTSQRLTQHYPNRQFMAGGRTTPVKRRLMSGSCGGDDVTSDDCCSPDECLSPSTSTNNNNNNVDHTSSTAQLSSMLTPHAECTSPLLRQHLSELTVSQTTSNTAQLNLTGKPAHQSLTMKRTPVSNTRPLVQGPHTVSN